MKRSALKRKAPLKAKGRRQKSWRKKLWPEFSKLIRARDGRCLMGGQFGRCAGVLQASHIHPKGAWPLLELFPLNVKTLCYRHHFYVWPNRPIEMDMWLQKTLGSSWLFALEHEKLNSIRRKHMTEADQRDEWRRYGLTR